MKTEPISGYCPTLFLNQPQEEFYKNSVLKNFAKIYLEAPVPEPLLKVACLQLYQKRP